MDVVNHNQTLTFRIHNQIKDQELGNRLYKFMSIWGNGKPEEYTDEKNVTYISSIRKEVFEDFAFPIVDMDKVTVPDPDPAQVSVPGPVANTDPVSKPSPSSELQLPSAKVKKVNDANNLLTKWTNEKKIDISATVGAAGTVHSAIYDEIPDYLFSAINWQVEGISMDNADKVKNSTFLLVALEGQTKKEGLYTLPATWNSVNIILAFIRWKEFGNKSWNYPDADFDAYLITTWTESVKKDIVKKVAEYKEGIESSYIDAAVSAEIYRTILAGEFREKSLKNFNLQALLASKPNKTTSNMHSSEWNKLLTVMSQKNADKNNQDTVRKYFNIGQAGASKIIVLDSIALSKTFSKVKRNRLQIEDSERQNDDRITQRRDAYTFLADIEERIEAVAKAELEVGRSKVQLIFDALGDDEVDETIISEFVTRVKKFYDAANSAQVNVKEISLEPLKKTANLEKAILDIANAMEEEDPLNIIMAFSGDPVSVITPFVDIITNLEAEVEKANLQIKTKLDADGGNSESENRYKTEQEVISQCKEKIERMVNV